MATNTTATSQNHNGTGSQNNFAISFAFLANTEVDVTVGGVLKTLGTHYNIVGSEVQFTSGNTPPSGTGNVKFTRDTNISTKKVDFKDGSVLTEIDLDTNSDQVLFAQQEITDKLAGIEEGATADQTDAEIRTAVENASDSNVFTDADHTKLNNIEDNATQDQTASEIKTLIASSPLDASHLAANSVDTSELADNAVSNSKLADAELRTLAGMQAATASKLADSTALTSDIADLNQLDGMAKQTTITDDDTKFPTSGAVVDFVAAQIAPIGGLEVIANEDSFPTTQPVSGVVVSISDIEGLIVNGSGVATNARTSGNGSDNVTINGFPSSLQSKTMAAGLGLMVSSTGSSQTYTYHKLLAKEEDVEQLSNDINDFAARYRVTAGEPTSNNDEGDLIYDTNADKMKVFDSATNAFKEVTSVGDYKFLFLCPTGGTGSPTINGNIDTYDLREGSTSGSAATVTNAAQLIVSINGVIQKPNTGTSAPSEGFAMVDSNTIIFGSNLPTGSSIFIIQIGSATTLNVPADNSVSTAKLQSGSINNAKVATNAAIDVTKLSFTQTGTSAVARTVDSRLKEVVSVTDFGAVGNSNIETGGGTDDTVAINLAITAAKAGNKQLYAPPNKVFRITSAIDLKGITDINFEGRIFVNNITSEPAVVIGGLAQATGAKIYFREIHDGSSRIGSSPTHPLLRINGLKNSLVEIGTCRYIQVYSNNASADTGSNGYNQFKLGHCHKVELKGENNLSWINENIFYGGRIQTLYIGTSTTEYKHNNNIFMMPTLEAAIDVNIQAGHSNMFRDVRFESANTGTVVFSNCAYRNVISVLYSGTGTAQNAIEDAIDPSRVTDAGYGNIITRHDLYLYNQHILFSLGTQTPLLISGTPGASASKISSNQKGLFETNESSAAVTSSGSNVTTPALGVLPAISGSTKMTHTFRDIYGSDYIPVEVGDLFGFEWGVSNGMMRYTVKIFDANQKPITAAEGTGGAYIGGALTFDATNGLYKLSTHLDDSDSLPTGVHVFDVRRSEVKYVRCYVFNSALGNVEHCTGYLYEKPTRQSRVIASSISQNTNFCLPSIPTGGFVKQGTICMKDDGTEIYICKFEHETSLTADEAGGSTSITVSNISSVANGDIVGIALADGTTHWGAVASLSSATFNISALPSSPNPIALAGARVVFNRWATLS